MKQLRINLTFLATLTLVLAIPASAELEPHDGNKIAVRHTEVPAVHLTRLHARSPGRPGKAFLQRIVGKCCGPREEMTIDSQSQSHVVEGPRASNRPHAVELPERSSRLEDMASEAGNNDIRRPNNGDVSRQSSEVGDHQPQRANRDGDRHSSHTSDSGEVNDVSHESYVSHSSDGSVQNEDYNSDGRTSTRRQEISHIRDGTCTHDSNGRRTEKRLRTHFINEPMHAMRPTVKHVARTKKSRHYTTKTRTTHGNRNRRIVTLSNTHRSPTSANHDSRHLDANPPPLLALTEHGENSGIRSATTTPPATPVSGATSFHSDIPKSRYSHQLPGPAGKY